MTAQRCISALLFLVLAASPALAATKAKDPQATGERPQGVGSPTDVLDDIERGWMDHNADLILRHFGSGKVAISIDGSGPGGSYSKDQGHYVFKELFKATHHHGPAGQQLAMPPGHRDRVYTAAADPAPRGTDA